ncbi:MAG: WYL domain-containing protein [Saprospirales bacterium]|nr:MAG: WYL domain-containing protein [Saprospirales bacterium]
MEYLYIYGSNNFAMEKEKPVISLIKAINHFHRGVSMRELAALLGVSYKTAYRYKEKVESIGFQLEKNPTTHRYKIAGKNRPEFNLSFSQQEVDFILNAINGDSEMHNRIRNKVYIHSDLQYLPGKLIEVTFGHNIKQLQKAIKDRKRVVLKAYNSVNSNSCRDILTEPVIMQDYYKRLYGYTPEKRKMIQYKTERIGSVEILQEGQMFTDRHIQNPETDVFWWMFEDRSWEVSLEFNRGAYHMIREEYPRIDELTSEIKEGIFRFNGRLASLVPPASIVLRFPGEVRIVSPPELENLCFEKLKKLPFF